LLKQIAEVLDIIEPKARATAGDYIEWFWETVWKFTSQRVSILPGIAKQRIKLATGYCCSTRRGIAAGCGGRGIAVHGRNPQLARRVLRRKATV